MLPYAGARCGVMWRENHEPQGLIWFDEFAVGFSLFARGDLRHGTATVDYGDGVCLEGCRTETAKYRVGGWTAGVALEIAMGW